MSTPDYSRLAWELAQKARLAISNGRFLATIGPVRTGSDKYIRGYGTTSTLALQNLARNLDNHLGQWPAEHATAEDRVADE